MMADMSDDVRTWVKVERVDAIAHVVLDRPDAANALSFELLASLVEVIGQQVVDGVRGMVLSGAGGRFSAGADFDDLRGDPDDIAFDDAVAAVGRALAETPFPVVAAIEKHAFGAAVDVAWSCDAVVVARNARLAVPATKLGLLYNPEALVALHARIGDRAWRRLVLLGDELDGETAFSLGMGESLVAPGQAVPEALRLASAAAIGDEAAVAATKAFGRAISVGTAGDAEWQTLRQELLAADARLATVRARQQNRRGG